MIKLIFKIIWYIIVVVSLLLTVYFLLESQNAGVENLKDLFSNGFWEGIKQFFVAIWDGFKFACNIK